MILITSLIRVTAHTFREFSVCVGSSCTLSSFRGTVPYGSGKYGRHFGSNCRCIHGRGEGYALSQNRDCCIRKAKSQEFCYDRIGVVIG